jgi:hypothetical protein
MAYNAKGRTKNFPVFDCDSHIYEPPEVWDKFIPENQRDFAKTHFYRDADRLISVKNSKISFRNPDKWKYPGETWHPGLNKKIIGSVEPGTKEWDEVIGRNRSARDPLVRLKDMDAAGIDQVMIFPSTFVYLPLVENDEGGKNLCSGLQRLGLPLLQRRFEEALSRGNPAGAKSGLRHRRTATRRQAWFQSWIGPADLFGDQISDVAGIRSLMEGI